MNKQVTKKVVATLTSVATVATMTAGAFMPMAAGAVIPNPWTAQSTFPVNANVGRLAADETNDVVFLSNGTNLSSYYLDGSLREVIDVSPTEFVFFAGDLYALYPGNIVKKYPGGHPAGATTVTLAGPMTIDSIAIGQTGYIWGNDLAGGDEGTIYKFDAGTGSQITSQSYNINTECTSSGDYKDWDVDPYGFAYLLAVQCYVDATLYAAAVVQLTFPHKNTIPLIGSDIALYNPSTTLALRFDPSASYIHAFVMALDTAANYMQVFDLNTYGSVGQLLYNVPFPSAATLGLVSPGQHKLYALGLTLPTYSTAVISCYWDGVGTPCPTFGSPTPTPDVINTVHNGKLKLTPGQSVILGPPAVLNGGLEGASDNTVTVQGGYVRVDGSVKLLDTLVIKSGATLDITGGLELTGSLVIESGATLIVGGKFTCPGSVTVSNNGSMDIGNNQCSALASASSGGSSAGSLLALAAAALAAGLGIGVYARRKA